MWHFLLGLEYTNYLSHEHLLRQEEVVAHKDLNLLVQLCIVDQTAVLALMTRWH